MLTTRPTQSVEPGEVVLQLALVRSWCWTHKERSHLKLVNGLVQIAIGAINSQIVNGHNGCIDGIVVDAYVSEAQFVQYAWTDKMGFSHAEKTIMDRQVEREIEVSGKNAAAQGSG